MILVLLAVCSSCIEPFNPDINEQQDVMVINGMITDTPGIHTVTISRSSPYDDPGFRPVDYCVVAVEDNEGNLEYYSYAGYGEYRANLAPPFLGEGKSYSLIVKTPFGEEYRSDYDTLLACPEVDSVYFMESADPDNAHHGIQFYNDVKGTKGGARNFRWVATATWEYHSPYKPGFVWSQGRVVSLGEGGIKYTCYLTETIQSVYAASTRFLTENSIYQNKLHYVSDQTPRLAIRYSLLLQQHSLTEAAYTYWERLGAQSTRSASFYETQPSSVAGNIYNVDRDWENVVGCFYATQVREKRIFVESEQLGFGVKRYTCRLDTVNLDNLTYYNYYYLISRAPMPPGPPWLTGETKCFDCTLHGGVTAEPDFW